MATSEASSSPDPDPPSDSPDAVAEEEGGSSVAQATSGGDDSTGPEEAEEHSPLVQAIKTPISEESPTGDSVLYDEDFQSLKTEIDKIGSASGEADYERIAELAREILAEKSKDLRAAGYLVLGEARCNGSRGMAEALRALRLLIDEYWEDLYPEKSRMQGRGSALQFLSDRLPDWLGTTSFEPDDREHLVAALEALDAIQEFSLEEMGEHAPSLSGLMNDLEGAVDDLPAPEPEPEPEPEGDSETDASAEEAGKSADADPEPATREEGTAPSEVASEADAIQVIRTAAGYYRDEDLSSPIPYRLIRTVRWSPLRDEPPNDGGTTRFEPPREQRRDYLEGLLADEQYETLVREGESSFQSGPFHVWLDLQRLVVSALEALGASYADAREGILVDLALLLRRVPALLSLTFSDGTPFATPLTVDWIESQVEPVLGRGGGSEKGGTGTTNGLGPLEEQYEAARQELRGDDLEKALSIMREEAAHDTSGKEEFHRQLYVASLCVKGGKPRVAQPLLDALDASIERHALDAWDPSLALEVWTNQCRCYDLLAQEAPEDESASFLAEADAAFEKICQIDPVHAVSVEGRRPS